MAKKKTSKSSIRDSDVVNNSVVIFGLTKKILISLGILLILLVGSVGYILGLNNNQVFSNNSSTISITTTPTSISQPTKIPPIKMTMSEIKKRQYDSSKPFFKDKNFPTELTSISETDLVGLSCSPYYVTDFNGGYDGTSVNGAGSVKLTDEKLLALFEQLRTSTSEVSSGAYCNTEDNRTFVLYSYWAGGGGTNNVSYVGLVNDDNSVTKKATIPNDGVAYFVCGTLLQLTKDNILYVKCGGGDGGSGGVSMYSVNLENSNLQQIQKCNSDPEKFVCTHD